MKLFEIVSPQVRTVKPISRDMRNRLSDNDSQAQFSGTVDNKSIKQSGGGSFADVYTHKKRPGSVIKVGKYSTDTPEQDAYLSYINLLVTDDRMASNPYFPRVYDVKVYPYDEEFSRTKAHLGEYVIELEKLEHMDVLSTDELNSLSNRIFKDWKRDGPHIAKSQFSHLPSAWRLQAALVYMMREAVMHFHGEEMEQYVRDPKFAEAALLVRELINRRHIVDDLHINNVMVRRTSVGPQLVITDPVKN